MKIGDKLYCKLELFNWLTPGEYYTVISYDNDTDDFCIFDNQNDINTFNLKKRHDTVKSFHEYFISLSELRKLKLEKLKSYENRR